MFGRVTLVVAALLVPLTGMALYPQPAVTTRTEWGARSPQCSISQCTPWEHVTIHHTAASSDYTVADHSYCDDRVRAHQNYHMDVNGWCDVGYNFLICKHGVIFEGREGSLTSYARGAHDAINCPGLGPSCMGYFHDPVDNEPTAELLDALSSLIAWQWDALGRDPYGTGTYGGATENIIGGHKDVGATACPGDLLYDAYIGSNPSAGWIRDDVCTKMETCTGGPPDPPAAPSNLSATAISSSQIDLTWSDNSSDEDNFVIERKWKKDYSVVATVGADATTYSDTGLSKNRTYTYRVKAVNAGGSSAYSNEASATTPRK